MLFFDQLEIVFDIRFTVLIILILLTHHLYLHWNTKNKITDNEVNILANKIIHIESVLSKDGGLIELESSPLKLIVEPETIETPTKFSIKECKIKFNSPFETKKQTPVFELEPHSINFKIPVLLEIKLINAPVNVCLYKQDNNENDKLLNKWLVKFPEKNENNNLLFKLNSFSFGFIGQMNMGIDANCNEIPCVEFNQKFKSYQFIYPGLNYRIICENIACVGNKELIIIKRGFGEFHPNIDIDENQRLKTIKCPCCDLIVTKSESIKMIILFQSKGSIKFKINKKGEKQQISDFDVNGNSMVIFGDENKDVNYSSLVLSVNQSRSAKSTGKDLIAGITAETIEKIKINNNLQNQQPIQVEAFTTYYNKIAGKNDVDQSEKKEINRDQYGNLNGASYDLCPNDAFKGETIAVLHLYTSGFDFSLPKAALEQKGFSLIIWRNTPPDIQEFRQALKKSCQLWIISNCTVLLNVDILQEIKLFFDEGKGVFIWGDNEPYYADANKVSMYLFNGYMYGNVPGCQCVEIQKEMKKAGLRKNHLITTGIIKLYEGETIATIADNENLEPLVYGSANNVVTSIYDKNGKRAIIDGGFTRLYCNWDTAGTARFVVNAATWLVNVEKTKIGKKN